MRSSYEMNFVESCVGCERRDEGLFCGLEANALRALDSIKFAASFPKGAMLFIEGQAARGVFVLCTGGVKLSVCSGEAKVLITQIADPGELLGLCSTLSGQPYEVTAETLSPCQVSFIRREDFLRFLSSHPGAALHVAQLMSRNYRNAHEQARLLALSHSAAEKFARLLLERCARHGRVTERGIDLKLTLTHEELGQLIGASRETVTRLISEFKLEQIIQVKGATLVVLNIAALEARANNLPGELTHL
ncbi:MAG TPA: Crp/Fnr family transcriptional regulator [Pyrinomonadaceae bacterium]